ncbi:MAG: hypothetical protein AB8I08_15280 [Sandaracinaceae bacterium]
MRLFRAFIVVLFVLASSCTDDVASPDAQDEQGLQPGGKADGTDFSACELEAVVASLNGGVSDETLRADGVHPAAADHLVQHRDGPDGAFGTDDDDLFDDIEEVDAVDYVGLAAMRQLVARTEQRCGERPEGCPDALILGRAGAVERDVFDVPFSWGDGWSVGEPITVAVPADLTGLTIAVVSGEVETGLNRVTLDGRTLLDVERDDPDLGGTVGPFFHVPVPAGALAFPMGPGSELTAGCLTVVPAALEDLTTARLTFVSRRLPRGGAMGINAIVVGDSDIDEDALSIAFQGTEGVFDELTVGPVEVHALDWDSPFVASEGAGINALRAAFVSEDPSRLNVFFVQDFLEEGTLGFAAGIPGPNGLQGTAASGVVISLDSHLDADGALDLATMGETIAHEIGHQLGLFHTTEEDGLGHDALDGTPECGAEHDADGDGSLTTEECVGRGARNVMFWTSGDVRQTEMSADQTEVIASSVVVQ